MASKMNIIPAGILTAFFLSCGFYSFGGSIPSDIKKIAIPLFDDNTSYPGVREDLTNQVIDGFIADNTLEIANESEADLLLTGTILSIREQAAIVTTDEDVEQFDVYVTVKVKCENLKTGKVWWENTLRRFGTMSGIGSQDQQIEAIQEAIVQIKDDILNNTLANW
jgi:hypothetical protein